MLGFVLYGLALPFLSAPLAKRLPSVFATCPFREILHEPCLLCGLTRAMSALIQGRLHAAQSLNPLAVPVAVLMAAELVYRVSMLVVERKRAVPRAVVITDAALHAALLLLYVGLAAGAVLQRLA